ncbi:MAG: zinc-binding alcohol dehydrogenase family protein [Gemmatimonadaceae bacterium]|jgi:NADPH:quinone reductase-like Zn-dependent oxidoreductase|nr:zinc-binding alcohol dehydrogenase family protein [Gemmatimonadaceae bacterium]
MPTLAPPAPARPVTTTSRVLAVFGTQPCDTALTHVSSLTIDGMPVRAGVHRRPDPAWHPATTHRRHVLLQVLAFSLNYRDKAFLERMVLRPSNSFFPIGSEFCARVVAVGDEVRSPRVGDRVMGDNTYIGPTDLIDGERGGVPTNQASCETLVLPATKVMGVPDSMSDTEAACFSLNAQTAFSMCRRIEARAGSRVLVTGASSSTSLFSIGALTARGAIVTALTSATERVDRLHTLGVHEVIVRPRNLGRTAADPLHGRGESADAFDAVIDPFFDAHAMAATGAVRAGGRYITCGFAAQIAGNGRGSAAFAVDGVHLAARALMRNVTIIGNCLGLRGDLTDAIDAHQTGRLGVVVDSVFEDDVPAFLRRTWVDGDRFGKVAFHYGS